MVVEDADNGSGDEDGVTEEDDSSEENSDADDETEENDAAVEINDADDVTEENDTAVEIGNDSSDQNDLHECIEVIVKIIRKLFGNTAVVEDTNSRIVSVDSVKDISWTVSVEPHSLPILEVVSSIVTTVQNCSCASIATDKLLSGNTIRTISDKVRFAL